MDISNSSRVGTSWSTDATSEESDSYYAELEKEMLQLIREDDDDNKSLTKPSPPNYSMPRASSFPAVTRLPHTNFFDRTRNVVVSLPNWLPPPPPLPTNPYIVESGSGTGTGTGTGVFIPLPSTRIVPSGNATTSSSRRRMYKRTAESTNN